MGLHSNKNFVTTNAIEAILAKPKQMPEDFRCVRPSILLGLGGPSADTVSDNVFNNVVSTQLSW